MTTAGQDRRSWPAVGATKRVLKWCSAEEAIEDSETNKQGKRHDNVFHMQI